MSRNSKLLVGRPVERMEDARLLSGWGALVDDLDRRGLLHAAVLRSSIAHARILCIDASAALRLNGVHAIITATDIGPQIPIIPFRLAPFPEFEAFRQPVIAVDKVRYVGEPIAVVIADSPARAGDAMDAIAVRFEPRAAVSGRAGAETAQAPLLDAATDNVALRYTAGFGDADAAFASADYVRTERFSTQRHTALPMETRGLLAEWDASAGRLVVSGASKVPFFNRRVLAKMLNLPQEAIDLIEGDVGGGFGVGAELYPED